MAVLTRFQEKIKEKVPLIDLRAPPQVKRRIEWGLLTIKLE